MNIKQAWEALWNKKGITMMNQRAIVVNGSIVWVGDNLQAYVKDGYQTNDIIFSIINLIVEKAKIAPWGLYTVQDEGSLKRMKAMQGSKFGTKGTHEIRALQKKALKPIDGSHPLKDLLQYANPEETFTELFANFCGYKLLNGNGFIYGNQPGMGINAQKPKELHLLPSQYMTILAEKGFPIKKVGYKLNQGLTVDFTTEQVLHDKYWNPDWDFNGLHLYGMSPIRAALKVLTRDNSALTASSKAFQNNGMEGVLFVDDERLSGTQAEAQAGAIKQKVATEYSGEDNFKKIVVSGYKTGWQQMGLSPVDLNILESEKWDLRRLCSVFGVSSELLNDPDNKTFANREEAEMSLTTRCALPLLTSFRNTFNRKLQTDWGYKGQNIYVDFDMDVFSELQDDKKTLAEWLNTAWWITPKQRYEMMELEIPDYVDQAELEKIYIPTTLTELGMQDLTNQLNAVDGMGTANSRDGNKDPKKG